MDSQSGFRREFGWLAVVSVKVPECEQGSALAIMARAASWWNHEWARVHANGWGCFFWPYDDWPRFDFDGGKRFGN